MYIEVSGQSVGADADRRWSNPAVGWWKWWHSNPKLSYTANNIKEEPETPKSSGIL